MNNLIGKINKKITNYIKIITIYGIISLYWINKYFYVFYKGYGYGNKESV